MPWFFVDDAFADSKPVMKLDRTLRNEAIGLWVRCGAWSAKEETDGRVPLDIIRQFNGSPRLIRALQEQAELWTGFSPKSAPKSHQNPTEILFKNWEKWQKTHAENEARRKREAEKKQTWRAAKKGRDYVTTSSDSEMSTGDTYGDAPVDRQPMSTGDSPGMSTGESRYPDPTRPDPTHIPIKTSSGGVTSVDAKQARPQCLKHPNENPTGIPCYACMKRREWDDQHGIDADADELERKRAAKAAALKAMQDCALCDEDGWVLGNDGTPVEPAVKCQAHHDQQQGTGA